MGRGLNRPGRGYSRLLGSAIRRTTLVRVRH